MATGLNFLKSYFLASESTTTGANPGNILTTAKVRSSKILGCALLKMGVDLSYCPLPYNIRFNFLRND